MMTGTPAVLVADLLVIAHLGFILFVVFGGFAAIRWPRTAWVHLPAAAWGAIVELAGWVCPLTPIENRLRIAGGDSAYSGDFIERYLLPVIYPTGLTREIQVALGIGVVALNLVAYAFVARRLARGVGRHFRIGVP